jgi:hypothetical protein
MAHPQRLMNCAKLYHMNYSATDLQALRFDPAHGLVLVD